MGLVDSELKGERYVDFSNPNVLYYFGMNRAVWGDGHKAFIKAEGNGYGEGDTIKMSADMETGEVNWVVNGKQEAGHTW